MSHVRIVMSDHCRGEVFVDGMKLEGVVSVEFHASAAKRGDLNRVLIALAPARVEIEGPAAVIQAPFEGTPCS